MKTPSLLSALLIGSAAVCWAQTTVVNPTPVPTITPVPTQPVPIPTPVSPALNNQAVAPSNDVLPNSVNPTFNSNGAVINHGINNGTVPVNPGTAAPVGTGTTGGTHR